MRSMAEEKDRHRRGGGREGVMKKRRRRERGRNEAEGRITRQ